MPVNISPPSIDLKPPRDKRLGAPLPAASAWGILQFSPRMLPLPQIPLDDAGDDAITIRRATLADLNRVRAVVHDATRRVQEKGYPECRLYFTEKGEGYIRARVRGDGGQVTYLATRNCDGRDVGVYTLSWDDVKHWGDTLGNDGRAGYVHMLNVHRDAARTGVGARLLRHAESLIAAALRPLVRIDCWNGNPFLLAYYARAGFAPAAHQLRADLVLWEKAVVG
jgi:ribosomal protein S18 acetylase RimI-like enzyme